MDGRRDVDLDGGVLVVVLLVVVIARLSNK
jgi:hypothetical protein